MLGLLLKAIYIIMFNIFILISHLQPLLSTFERMSLFFDRKINVISALNEILLVKIGRDLRFEAMIRD